jgi:hypothetical protein
LLFFLLSPVTVWHSDLAPVLHIVSDVFPDCLHVSANCSMFTFPLPVSGFRLLSVVEFWTEVFLFNPEFSGSCLIFDQFRAFIHTIFQ